MNLALHEADVIVDEQHPDQVIERVGVACRRGLAQLVAHGGGGVIRSLMVTSIVEVQHQRVYRLSGPDGSWLVRSVGGCRTCAGAEAWPGPQ